MSGAIFFKEEINNSAERLKNTEISSIFLANNYRCELERIVYSRQIKRQMGCLEKIVNFFPDEINEIFINVVNEIVKLKSFNFFIPSDDFLLIKKLMEEFKKENPQPIDYDKYWFAFNQKYFFKNLYKAFVTIKYIQNHDLIAPKNDLTVIDVGCGAGVFTIAWTILFGECKTILVDRNKFQLELAKQIVTRIFEGNKYEFSKTSFPDELNHLCGIRLFSYFFCEQENDSIFFDVSNLSIMIGEGALIIDYRYIIDRLQKITYSKFKFIRWTIKVENIPQILVEKDQKEQYIYGAYIRSYENS